METTRLEYQSAEANQYASRIAFQENEPITAAAKIAHCKGNQSNQEEVSRSEGRCSCQKDPTNSNRDKVQFYELAFPPAIQVLQQFAIFFGS